MKQHQILSKIFYLLFVLKYASGSTFNSIIRLQRQTNNETCSSKYEVRCNTGQCIPHDEDCNFCPNIKSTHQMKVTCIIDDIEIGDCDKPITDMIANFKCPQYHELSSQNLVKCIDGSWTNPLPYCKPICGKKYEWSSSNITLLSKHAFPVAEKANFPWNVLIYDTDEDKLVCQGNLVSPRIVLTTVFCAKWLDERLDFYIDSNYTIAAGKYYTKLNDSRDADFAQYSKAEKVVFFQKLGKYQGVGIVITSTFLALTPRVQPICLDFPLLQEPNEPYLSIIQHFPYAGICYPHDVENLQDVEAKSLDSFECSGITDWMRHFEFPNYYCVKSDLFRNITCTTAEGGAGVVYRKKTDDKYYLGSIIEAGLRDWLLSTKIYTYLQFIENVFANYSRTEDQEANPNVYSAAKVTNGGCILPANPYHGNWTIHPENAKKLPGEPIEKNTILRVFCDISYKLYGEQLVVCENGKWSAPIGQCLAVCPDIFSTEKLRVTCNLNGFVTENCTQPLSGTQAKFTCNPFYEDLQLSSNPIRICRRGKWDYELPNCIPICGNKAAEVQTLILGGVPVQRGEYPWQVALYRNSNKVLICGGSLISPRVVLTAAHCVTNVRTNLLNPKENYLVAVGKYYRSYNDTRDRDTAQFSTIYRMFIPDEYKGLVQNYEGDIAVIITNKRFRLSLTVQPVCLDRGLANEALFHEPNIDAYVSGWGNTVETGKPSEVLKELKVPSIDYEQCNENLPREYAKYLTHDKLCAGYLNQSSNVCQGDSGGGLVFYNRLNGRFYLTGIVSIAPRAPTAEGGCNSQTYALYTKVSKYINKFILAKENSYGN